jgi:cytochrome P450
MNALATGAPAFPSRPLRGPRAWLWSLQFLRDPIRCLGRAYHRFGPLTVAHADPLRRQRQYVLALGPEFNRQVLGDAATFYSMGQTVPGPPDSALRRLRHGLTRTNGEKHRQQRRLLMPLFVKNAAAGHVPDMAAVTAELVEQWPAARPVDMWLQMRRLSLRLSARILFGREDPARADALSGMIQEVLQRTFSPAVWLFPVNVRGTPYRKLLQWAQRIEQDLLAMIRRRRDTPAPSTDVLGLLVRVHDEELVRVLDALREEEHRAKAQRRGNRSDRSARALAQQNRIMDSADLVGQAGILFAASYENVANVLTWTLFLLAQHPAVMSELAGELDQTLGGEPPTAAQLDQLPLLDAVIKEALRVLPPVPYLIRAVSRPADLGGLSLREGDRVICSPYMTHHLPGLFPEPERFRPQRWFAIRPGPYEYLPFGAGPRMCIGYSFAMTEIKVALSLILRRWQVQVVPGARIDRSVQVTMAPRHGLPMLLQPRGRRLQAVPVRGDIHDMVDLTGTACAGTARLAAV